MIDKLIYLKTLAACKAAPYGIVIPCRQSADNNPVLSGMKVALAAAGAVSVLFVVIGGFRYVISSGDPQSISKAKNTIIYAVIGLTVSLTAYGIVAFVIGKVS